MISKLPTEKAGKNKGGITMMTTAKSRQFRRRGKGTTPCSTVPTTATITATRKELYRRPRRGNGYFGRR